MIRHPAISVLFLFAGQDPSLPSLLSYLQSIPHIRLTAQPRLTGDLESYDVVMSFNEQDSDDTAELLTQFVRNGGGWLMLAGGSEHSLPPIFGAQPEPLGLSAELRVLFENTNHPLAARLPDAVYIKGFSHTLTRTSDESETILYADWQYRHRAVLILRREGRGRVACTTLRDFANPHIQRMVYRLLCHLSDRVTNRTSLGIGILGYAQSVGRIHALGAEKTPGLALRVVCDLNQERLSQAQKDFPDIRAYDSVEKMVDDPEVDLVIVATPPNNHAPLCLQMMNGGKHVVCEKPLALNRQETDALTQMAVEKNVHLSCHQNRRWDPDYLAIKQSLAEGLIGDLFYLETFVGGFAHPCGYWHSHAAVSGGTSYDWGAHYLDWIVSLIPERVQSVIGTRHKRVWHDVTNADQERIQIRFAGGKEAEFMHSDVAAARKPKWYLLGTQGALVGQWRDHVTYANDPVVYYRQHTIPATEMTPDLMVFQRHQNGNIINLMPAIPNRKHFQFHSNLADHLLLGEPIAATLEDAVKVVTILEAAARSMANGGTLETVNGGAD